jgi:hypothetical protein
VIINPALKSFLSMSFVNDVDYDQVVCPYVAYRLA